MEITTIRPYRGSPRSRPSLTLACSVQQTWKRPSTRIRTPTHLRGLELGPGAFGEIPWERLTALVRVTFNSDLIEQAQGGLTAALQELDCRIVHIGRSFCLIYLPSRGILVCGVGDLNHKDD